jgi:hypothetical protein
MHVEELPNGHLLVPARAESEDPEHGTVLGDGMIEIGPDHPDYAEWREDLEASRAREAEIDAELERRRAAVAAAPSEG